jgi:hypothetical protein
VRDVGGVGVGEGCAAGGEGCGGGTGDGGGAWAPEDSSRARERHDKTSSAAFMGHLAQNRRQIQPSGTSTPDDVEALHDCYTDRQGRIPSGDGKAYSLPTGRDGRERAEEER